MADARPFAHLTNRALKGRAAWIVEMLEAAPAEKRAPLFNEVEALRDEMLERLGREGPDDPGGGVREPRRPWPGGGAAAAAVDPQG